MIDLSPEFLAKSKTVFTGVWPTLESVRENILSLEPSIKRRDALSAFAALTTSFKVDLAETPATFPMLRRIFSTKNSVLLTVGPKRFANVRTEVFKAVRKYGVPSPNLSTGPALTHDWKALLIQVENKDYRSILMRLGRFCSAMDIAAPDVGREALLGLYEALQGEGSVKDPHVIIRLVTSYWNYCEKRLPSWPRIRLKTPFASNRYLLALPDLPTTLRNDILRWQKRRLGGDLLSLDKVAHRSRPLTVEHQTAHVLRYLGLVVKYNLANLQDLSSLTKAVEPTLVRAVVKILLEQQKLTIGYAHSFAYVLVGIARHETKLSRAKVTQLATLAANLRHQIKKGMTKKNRSLLRQFDKPEQVAALLGYSDTERQRGDKQKNSLRKAKCYERALVADLLIHSALRIKNIVHLRADTNMRKRGGTYILTYTGDEMKNGHDHEIELPQWLSVRIDEFTARYRPMLKGHKSSYLFPGEVSDGHRHHSAIRNEFSEHILKRLGLQVNPHFMRHLTSKVLLDEDPGLLKIVSNRLGHTTTETAQLTYLETDSLAASRKANSLLSALPRKLKQKQA